MRHHRARDGAGDRDNRANGEVDPSGRDDERHPERDHARDRAEAEDVDEVAVEVAVQHPHGEEAVAEESACEEEREDAEHRPHDAAG